MKPIIILGFARSGTSLLRAILNAHESIVIAPECGFAQWLYSKYRDYNSSYYDIELYEGISKDVYNSKKFETWSIDQDEIFSYLRYKQPKNYAQIVESIYKLYSQKNKPGYSRWGDKNNYYLNHLDILPDIYPNATYILIIRSILDVCGSLYRINKQNIKSKYKPRYTNNAYKIADEWKSLNNSAISFLKSLNQDQNIIRYERLVTDPKPTIRKICNILDIDFSIKMTCPQKNNSLKEPEEYHSWKKKLNEPISIKNIDSYKEVIKDPKLLRHCRLTEKQVYNTIRST